MLPQTTRFQGLLEAMPDAVVGVDTAGIIRFLNRRTDSLFGYDRGQLIGQRIDSLLPDSSQSAHPARRASYLADLAARSMEAGIELTGQRRDGSQFPVQISLTSFQTREGPLVTASVRDVTEQVQTDKALAGAVRQYRLLAENASDLVVLASPDRVITWVSPSVTRKLGWAPEDLIGTRLVDLIHPDDAAATAALREAVCPGAEITQPADGAVLRIRTKLGGYRRMSGDVTPVDDEAGVHVGIVSGLRDVEALVQAREIAHADRVALRATLDSLLDPHVRYDAVRDETGQIVDFRYAEANPAACAYVGLDHGHLVGRRMLDLFPGVVDAGLLDQYRLVVETGEPLVLDDVVYPLDLLSRQERHLGIRSTRVGDGLSQTWREVTGPYVAAPSPAEPGNPVAGAGSPVPARYRKAAQVASLARVSPEVEISGTSG